MTSGCGFLRGVAPLAIVLGAMALLATGESRVATQLGEEHPPTSTSSVASPRPEAAPAVALRRHSTELLSGRVVFLAEALQRLYQVATEPAAAETAVALETADGRLWPIVPDVRGQALLIDPRLREAVNEIEVRRWQSQPLVQVMRVFHRRGDELFEVDYWCDVCSISMPILKDCDCCQGSTRLREVKVTIEPGDVHDSTAPLRIP